MNIYITFAFFVFEEKITLDEEYYFYCSLFIFIKIICNI